MEKWTHFFPKKIRSHRLLGATPALQGWLQCRVWRIPEFTFSDWEDHKEVQTVSGAMEVSDSRLWIPSGKEGQNHEDCASSSQQCFGFPAAAQWNNGNLQNWQIWSDTAWAGSDFFQTVPKSPCLSCLRRSSKGRGVPSRVLEHGLLLLPVERLNCRSWVMLGGGDLFLQISQKSGGWQRRKCLESDWVNF